MKKIEHILVTTDFSPRSDRAVRGGAQLAKEHGAKLDLLHVLPILTFEAHAHAEMEKIAEGCARGNAQVTFIVEQGRPRVVILQQVRALHIDLVVIGKRGETELDEALFGSVTKHVFYETSCDVLVVSSGLLKQSEKDDLGGKHS